MKLKHQRYISVPYSLIELLILITIIFTVLSLVFPFLFKGWLQAQSTRCQANLKQLGIWFSIYQQQYDGYLPSYEDGWVKEIGRIGGIKVNQKGKPKKELSCPSQPFKSFIPSLKPNDYWRGSYYGINQHIASHLTDSYKEFYPQWTQIKIKQIDDPSLKVLLADSCGSNFFSLENCDPTVAGISMEGTNYTHGLPPKPAKPFPYHRHIGGTVNFLFLDGHVEAKKSWPIYMAGPGTSGYYFWSGEHVYSVK